MGIKVEVITPTSSVSEVEGESTVVTVVRNSQSPITTNGGQSVVEVVKTVSVINNAVVSSEEPADPFEGMIWIEVPA